MYRRSRSQSSSSFSGAHRHRLRARHTRLLCSITTTATSGVARSQGSVTFRSTPPECDRRRSGICNRCGSSVVAGLTYAAAASRVSRHHHGVAFPASARQRFGRSPVCRTPRTGRTRTHRPTCWGGRAAERGHRDAPTPDFSGGAAPDPAGGVQDGPVTTANAVSRSVNIARV